MIDERLSACDGLQRGSPMSLRALNAASGTLGTPRTVARQPLFAEPLHVGRPNLGNRDRLLDRFAEVLDRKWLTNNGPCVQEFEARVADYLGVRHCIAVCNATAGL